eukprot:g1205.t1
MDGVANPDPRHVSSLLSQKAYVLNIQKDDERCTVCTLLLPNCICGAFLARSFVRLGLPYFVSFPCRDGINGSWTVADAWSRLAWSIPPEASFIWAIFVTGMAEAFALWIVLRGNDRLSPSSLSKLSFIAGICLILHDVISSVSFFVDGCFRACLFGVPFIVLQLLVTVLCSVSGILMLSSPVKTSRVSLAVLRSASWPDAHHIINNEQEPPLPLKLATVSSSIVLCLLVSYIILHRGDSVPLLLCTVMGVASGVVSMRCTQQMWKSATKEVRFGKREHAIDMIALEVEEAEEAEAEEAQKLEKLETEEAEDANEVAGKMSKINAETSKREKKRLEEAINRQLRVLWLIVENPSLHHELQQKEWPSQTQRYLWSQPDRLRADQFKLLRAAFNEMDVYGDGLIDAGDLSRTFASRGLALPRNVCECIVENVSAGDIFGKRGKKGFTFVELVAFARWRLLMADHVSHVADERQKSIKTVALKLETLEEQVKAITKMQIQSQMQGEEEIKQQRLQTRLDDVLKEMQLRRQQLYKYKIDPGAHELAWLRIVEAAALERPESKHTAMRASFPPADQFHLFLQDAIGMLSDGPVDMAVSRQLLLAITFLGSNLEAFADAFVRSSSLGIKGMPLHARAQPSSKPTSKQSLWEQSRHTLGSTSESAGK